MGAHRHHAPSHSSFLIELVELGLELGGIGIDRQRWTVVADDVVVAQRIGHHCERSFPYRNAKRLVPAHVVDVIEKAEILQDLLEQRADLAIRVGTLRPSQLTLRKLGESPMRVVAAPDYLARCGTPRDLEELERHNRIGYGFARVFDSWPFRMSAGENVTLPVLGNAQVSDGESLRRLTLAGAGIARLSLFLIAPDIKAGRLVPILEGFNPGDTEEINVLFLGQGGYLPSRVRAVIEFLVATVPRRLNETIRL